MVPWDPLCLDHAASRQWLSMLGNKGRPIPATHGTQALPHQPGWTFLRALCCGVTFFPRRLSLFPLSFHRCQICSMVWRLFLPSLLPPFPCIFNTFLASASYQIQTTVPGLVKERWKRLTNLFNTYLGQMLEMAIKVRWKFLYNSKKGINEYWLTIEWIKRFWNKIMSSFIVWLNVYCAGIEWTSKLFLGTPKEIPLICLPHSYSSLAPTSSHLPTKLPGKVPLLPLPILRTPRPNCAPRAT